MGSVPAPSRSKAEDEEDEEALVSQQPGQDVAKVPYMEVTGQDSVTCPTCRGSGCIPTEQVHELVALIPYSDQRLRPHRTKLYVLLSVLLCLLLSALGVFFLFPRGVQVKPAGIRVVQVWFDSHSSAVLLAITATLRISNSNFCWVALSSLSSQVQYMNTVVNFTVKAELGGSLSYLYFFCTLPKVKVHNIVILMRTSVKLSYLGHSTQSTLETFHYLDCSSNSTAPALGTP
ncbi:transmembrane protein 106C isoform X2 [Haemorhous mexicanus]|uniref:transmembrane protein 106C isoform X2 n=1 Tax=Haemorhous mexicanus TaxID=30427 RepID=UPI0028BF0E26|nr:transmembrane protein 106C isoform X2 [Haemorhous mexicanus]